jgi:hypothetical protein
MDRDEVQRLRSYIKYLKNEEARQRRIRMLLALSTVVGASAVASGGYLIKLFSDSLLGSATAEEEALILQSQSTPGTPILHRLPAMTCFQVADGAVNLDDHRHNYCAFNPDTADDTIIKTRQGSLPARFILEACKQLAEKICAIVQARSNKGYLWGGIALLGVGGLAFLLSCLGRWREKKLGELPFDYRNDLILDAMAAGVVLDEEGTLGDARRSLEGHLERHLLDNPYLASSSHAFFAAPAERKAHRSSSLIPEHKVEEGQGLTEPILPAPAL